MKNWVLAILIIGSALSGCATRQQVIIDPAGVDMAQFDVDLAQCQQVAEQVDQQAGKGALVGAVVGGVIIGVLENLAEFMDAEYLQLGNLYTIAPVYALIIILMIKPHGLFGTKDIERI